LFFNSFTAICYILLKQKQKQIVYGTFQNWRETTEGHAIENICRVEFQFIYLFLYTLLVFLFVYVCFQQTWKRLNRSGSNFVWNLPWQRKGLGMLKITKMCVQKFLILKMREQILSANFFVCYCSYCTQLKV